MRRLFLLLTLACMAACCAEIIDRLAVTVGRQAITQSDILTEIRLSAFLNQSNPDFGPASRKKTADRLVERSLFGTEMEIGKYPAPEPKEVEPQLAGLQKERFPSEEAYRKALSKYGIGEEALRQYLLQQIAVLRFIEARFGPGVQLLDADVRDYYSGRFVKEWENKNKKPAPALEEVRSEIEETLRAEQVDRLMDNWLKEARERTRIDYKSEAFQ
jgi:hypothetical protein